MEARGVDDRICLGRHGEKTQLFSSQSHLPSSLEPPGFPGKLGIAILDHGVLSSCRNQQVREVLILKFQPKEEFASPSNPLRPHPIFVKQTVLSKEKSHSSLPSSSPNLVLGPSGRQGRLGGAQASRFWVLKTTTTDNISWSPALLKQPTRAPTSILPENGTNSYTALEAAEPLGVGTCQPPSHLCTEDMSRQAQEAVRCNTGVCQHRRRSGDAAEHSGPAKTSQSPPPPPQVYP